MGNFEVWAAAGVRGQGGMELWVSTEMFEVVNSLRVVWASNRAMIAHCRLGKQKVTLFNSSLACPDRALKAQHLGL